MTIAYLAGSIITGLSSDTKPTTASNGSIFIETDTGSRFIINSGTWTQIVGGNLDGLTDVDLTTAAPTNNQVLTYTTTGTKWVPATPPGSGGGEANTTSNVGTGEGTLALAKSGVNLPFKSLKQGTNITLTNNANDVTITATSGGGSVTPSSTDTFTNKTINRTNNTIPFTNSHAFTIYREGGTVKLVTNATGAVASHTSLGPAVDAVLANTIDPSAEILSGFFDLASGFTGWNVVKLTNIKIHPNVYINVPQGYTDDVWKLSPTDTVVYNVIIDGGIYDEQGPTPTYLWDCIAFEPISTNPPTTTGAVYECEFKNMFIFRCNRPIYLHSTNKSWINQNRFINIYTEGGKIIGAEFEHTGTWTSGQSGINGNYFEDVSGQATALDTTNHFPATTYGFKNVIGEFNTFVHCVPWDLTVSGSAVSTMTIGANATATKVIGGIVDSVSFTDSGIRTSVNGWNGIQHNDQAIFKGRSEGWSPALELYKRPDAGYEQVAYFGLAGSADTFTVENQIEDVGAFAPLWRSNQLSTNIPSWVEGFHLQTNLKQANDTGTAPLIVFAGKTDTTPFTIGTTRPILGIWNNTTAAYNFYTDRFDLTNKKLVNVTISALKTGYSLVNTTPVTLTATSNSMQKVDASGGARTINLPAASGNDGLKLTIIKSDSSANNVTIDGATTETINGALTFVLTQQYQSVVLRCDGANWFTQPNSSERTGEATGTANGSTTVFNIAHGLGVTPSNVFVECSTHTGTFTRTKDSTNIVVTFGTAPAASPSTIKFDWRAIV